MKDTDEPCDMDDEVMVDCELDAPPERVWRALIVPELAGQWLEDGEARPPRHALVEAVPCTLVRYAWNGGEPGEPDTLVTIELSPAPQGRTRFRLTHGLAAQPPVAANTDRAPPMARAA